MQVRKGHKCNNNTRVVTKHMASHVLSVIPTNFKWNVHLSLADQELRHGWHTDNSLHLLLLLLLLLDLPALDPKHTHAHAHALAHTLALMHMHTHTLSVTSRCSTKTAKLRIKQTTPLDSPGTVVSWRQKSLRNSTGINPCGDAKFRLGGLNGRLSTNNYLYLENGTR